MAFIEVKDLKKVYKVGDVEIHAAAGVNFNLDRGKFTVVVGPSGAGKTTVMNILGGMDQPTSGTVLVGDKEVTAMNDRQMTQYRRDDVGFVFQSYNLISNLTALENVELATQIRKEAKDPKEILAQVGLGERMNNFPAQLSGGEQQRVAIARAIAKNPQLLLCDEPTGALDTKTGQQILQVLRDCSDLYGMTVVVITHNRSITEVADRVIEIKNGRVESDTVNKHVKAVDEIKW
ncbi:ABC transporter ATP-binding protein [Erysipelothrix sp. HDW6C]|uniref:ABC transporter ATP-binding protein n=1 Tax=Erysipelothrix sp. HDW6C TaxID=2714930 RepID=UPI00140E7245|nr:ABC transporter ATP-binding protein [Erysipelothrix sp. HDW6C]QIK70464.1 ABC transporter ATP-binding protein [Erysipelothrix sp. HDW6C]